MAFSWTDIDTLSPTLFDRPGEAHRMLSSADGTAHLYELGPEIGDGYVEYFQFADGLTMIVFNCSWQHSRTFDVEDAGRSRMSFTLDLNISMDVGSAVIDADTPAWRIMNNAPGVITHETVPAGGKTVWVTLSFVEEYLGRFLAAPLTVRNHPRLEVFRTRPKESLVESYPLDHQLNLITSNIISLNVHELITNALDRLLGQSHSEEESPVRLRAKDREAIKLARDILIANLAEPPTIRELCSAVGVNRNKLHYGFKEVFGLSPLQYLEEHRLEQAYIKLRDSDHLIYRIAADVGYSNQGNFSTAFKRKYGLTPKEARAEHRER
jgi:AraC-like DNA-binding protein